MFILVHVYICDTVVVVVAPAAFIDVCNCLCVQHDHKTKSGLVLAFLKVVTFGAKFNIKREIYSKTFQITFLGFICEWHK